ncbi:MAG: hypothetical protein AAF587_24765 [Bacteroidota bacterium]
MRIYIIMTFLASWTSLTIAQSTIGLYIGTSKSDLHTESIWYQHQMSETFHLGIQLTYGQAQYRFIQAKSVTEGSVITAGMPMGWRLISKETYRLDVNLRPSLRWFNAGAEYDPSSSLALELDPSISAGLRLNEHLLFHTGVMLRTVFELSPGPVLSEQLPSSILLNALSFQKHSSLISLRTYYGPMSGAGGDTEKFFWQVSIGIQRQLGASDDSAIPFFTF